MGMYVGRSNSDYGDVHGGYGFGERNTEDERMLEFCDATNMVVTNTMFSKRHSRVVTYECGSS